MSIPRHHTEWLSLVPVSGPFLSLPVLLQAFPQGLDTHDADHARLLRLAYEEWSLVCEGRGRNRVSSTHDTAPAIHNAWINFVLTQTLEYDENLLAQGQAIPQTLQCEMDQHGVLLRPDIVLNDPITKKARLLIQTYPRSQDLNNYVAGSRWKASPDTRMAELLHATGVRLGLVTNGEHWMLVDAPKGETTGYASWFASLWREEKITLRAFRSLLSMSRFFGVADDETIETLLEKSASNQQEVTDQLGLQVRKAVEVLIQSLDKADQDHARELLEGVEETVLYESALTVMMRLVFMFCAEERELIPTKPFPVYEQNYSVSSIARQLREIADQQGEELLERRYDAWPRLLTAFRIVFGGIRHDEIHVPAYGGRMFDPDRFPFLEGRKQGTTWQETDSNPLPVDNRTVLHLLEALQLLKIKVPGGGPAEARRVSFRALDIEQIGHVYEGLLDHTAKRAGEPFLGLIGSKKKEPELPLSELEKHREKSEDDLIKYLKDHTGKTPKSIEKALLVELDAQETARFRTACQSEELWERVKPFAGLIRNDSFGYPVIITQGSVFVTAGTDRRSSGTHYTPRSLTEPIVQYTLEPLVYVGPAEGKEKSDWKLKSAADLLDLKICDMACGSGAFLVQAARYMSVRLLEAWDEAQRQHPDVPAITPEGEPSTGKPNESLVPDDPDERKVYAMRIIAQRCLYGVDINPLAVEMAKLSLWLLTLAKDMPFEFLDHAIRCGDSLVGLHDLEQLKHFSLKPDFPNEIQYGGVLENEVPEAINLRLKLESMPANTVEDIKAQEKLLAEAEEKIARLKCAADLLVAAEFWGENAKDKQEKVRHAAVVTNHYIEKGPTKEFEQKAKKERRGQKMFHWPLEFPEVIVERGGFDAFVGNPPFMGGQKITGSLSTPYRNCLVEHIAKGKRGSADLCTYFLLRACWLIKEKGNLGYIVTNTISQGDTREVGLDQLVNSEYSIQRAVPSRPWPGTANLEITHLWLRAGQWSGDFFIDDQSVNGITSFLSPPGVFTGKPNRLKANQGKSFQGSIILGMGFVLEPVDAESLILQNPSNKDVLFPYLSGQDVNSRPDQSPSRWVINFFDWPLNRETASRTHEGAVASDYPDCLDIITEKVKPERTRKKDNGEFTLRKPLPHKWWIYAEKRPSLYRIIANMDRVLVIPETTKYCTFTVCPTDIVFSHMTKIITIHDIGVFALLVSSIHESWARKYSSTLETRLKYITTDAFETFPFPDEINSLRAIGQTYENIRSQIMTVTSKGLTKTLNHFHDPIETASNIQKLRQLHVEMDNAVAVSYGWDDLDLDHGFHETKQGIRYTISEPARREVLQRLLKLNHERYAEEVAQGLHDKKKKKKGGGKRVASGGKKKKKVVQEGPTLFDNDKDV